MESHGAGGAETRGIPLPSGLISYVGRKNLIMFHQMYSSDRMSLSSPWSGWETVHITPEK